MMDQVDDSDPRVQSDGRISMPTKRVMVKPERLKNKCLTRPRDCAVDSWNTEEEDAVLCTRLVSCLGTG
uniref:Uncharacterized protein n=1 Tax=Aegilops tauschii subsp. strangulata TaxID=200361 RepID=A0A452ZTT6_AEGTS